jgi:hypothetical protein
VPAEEVLILLRVEQVLGELSFSRQESEAAFSGHCRPEAVAPANGTVATVCALFKVEIGLEPDCPAVAAALVGFQHECTSQ